MFYPTFVSKKNSGKTYNSGDSPVVTHLTTNPPVHCLSTAERTGSSIFSVLWSYVMVEEESYDYIYSHGLSHSKTMRCSPDDSPRIPARKEVPH